MATSRATRSQAIRITRSRFQDSGRVGTREDDPIFYRFTLNTRTQVRVSAKNKEAGGIFSALVPELQIVLERSNGRRIRKQSAEGGEVESITARLDRGTYFVRITSGGQSVPYDFGFRSGASLFT
ncbi:MAG: T9SS type A sorting domain-containing protein [Oscillatoriophycideae cyanobacterium NC_groundwater_1537_Pr4_S-0.65um_50_18]|nr:T9SS type A sorting domain-containing protein [Oscillatoriophycideae cyanobacterium NC_groundwater_1537_Pr4_S-0.65um_50_18]